MKKILSLIILSLLIFTSCTKKEEAETSYDKIIKRDVLIVGVKEDSKPFGYISEVTGEYEGFDIDIARYIAQDMLGSERKIKFVSVTPNTRIEAITSGEVDMVIATMSITPQREYFIDFTQPYYIAGQTAMVREDSDIHTFADLRKKTTIVLLGSTSEKNIRSIIPTARIIGYKNYQDAFNAFEQGTGDAISTDNTILSGFLMNHCCYRILKNKISQEPYAIGIKKSEDDKKLKRNLDVIINRMQKDGTIKSLKEKWQLK